MHSIPCITDSDDWRFDADEPEEESPLSAMEQRIKWLFEEWGDAHIDEDANTWQSLRMMMHGAVMADIQCQARAEDIDALKLLQQIALMHEMECITVRIAALKAAA